METLICEYCDGKGEYEMKCDFFYTQDDNGNNIQITGGLERIECPKCNGTGKCDWVTNAMGVPKGQILKVLEQSLVFYGGK